MTKILPFAMLVLSLGACVVYAYSGDWRHALYWGSAALITVSVSV